MYLPSLHKPCVYIRIPRAHLASLVVAKQETDRQTERQMGTKKTVVLVLGVAAGHQPVAKQASMGEIHSGFHSYHNHQAGIPECPAPITKPKDY